MAPGMAPGMAPTMAPAMAHGTNGKVTGAQESQDTEAKAR